jgi:cardiolipin synthase A/B
MTSADGHVWLRHGIQAFASKLQAMAQARISIRLETYIFTHSHVGETILAALVNACRRGVKVQVLVDAWGSLELSDDFWKPLRDAGGQIRRFNPVSLRRLGFRDHRKLLICDDAVAFVGGFNISTEYAGDGVKEGWCDHGLRITGGLVPEMSAAFDAMYAKAELRHGLFTRLRQSTARRQVAHAGSKLLLCGPGRGRNHFKRSLHQDLLHARDVVIISAYFLPNWRIRRDLCRVVRKGGRVRILLGAKSDVAIAQLAARSLYQRLLRAGVEIFEYQPQVLHAKLFLVDGAVYVGSANLDTRSLHINYEVMVRLTHPRLVKEAREIFAQDLLHAVAVDKATWKHSRTFWQKLKERWAHFVLARLDPYLAQKQMRHVGSL